MVERASIHLALLAALASAGCSAEGEPLILDRACGDPWSTCLVAGDATVSTGLTGDAYAVAFGPAGGTLTIPMNALPEAREPVWSLEALVWSEDGAVLLRPTIDWTGADGTCGELVCPYPVPAVKVNVPADEVGWARIVDGQLGTSFATVPFEATMTLSAANLELYDLRTP